MCSELIDLPTVCRDFTLSDSPDGILSDFGYRQSLYSRQLWVRDWERFPLEYQLERDKLSTHREKRMAKKGQQKSGDHKAW